jgi:hypothetical protein
MTRHWSGILIAAVIAGLAGCGGDDGEGTAEEAGTSEQAGSGPAVVTGQITLNGVGARINGSSVKGGSGPEVALVPAGAKKFKLRETEQNGRFTVTGVEPGTYELHAAVTWDLAQVPAGTNVGPAQDRPCRADGYSVSNVFLGIASQYFVMADATPDKPFDVGPGEQVTANIEFDCDLRRNR